MSTAPEPAPAPEPATAPAAAPTWHALIGEPQCCDCLDLLARLPDGAVNLCFADPPYNIGVFAKMPPDEYLAWCERWIVEVSRVLAANGAFWVSHSEPDVLVDVSRIIERYGRGMVNWVTWDKWNLDKGKVERGECAGPLYGAMWKQVCSKPRQSFGQCAEYLIYHTDEGNWTAQCDYQRGFIFEPLRAYLAGEKERAGVSSREVDEHLGNFMSGHYFGQSQWALPTAENYAKLRELLNLRGNHDGEYLRREYEYLRREYEDLRREYEDLRRDYEHLRYTFNNPGKVSSVWQIPPAGRNGHPTPKPEALLERIVTVTSNPGDLVLDPFAGSFTTAVVAERLGRRWIACDIEPRYVELGRERLAHRQMQLALEAQT